MDTKQNKSQQGTLSQRRLILKHVHCQQVERGNSSLCSTLVRLHLQSCIQFWSSQYMRKTDILSIPWKGCQHDEGTALFSCEICLRDCSLWKRGGSGGTYPCLRISRGSMQRRLKKAFFFSDVQGQDKCVQFASITWGNISLFFEWWSTGTGCLELWSTYPWGDS